MTYRAKMQDGKVVFEGGIKPLDGVELRVEEVQAGAKESSAEGRTASMAEVLASFVGSMDDPSLPEDGSLNHDHYIYGAPKR